MLRRASGGGMIGGSAGRSWLAGNEEATVPATVAGMQRVGSGEPHTRCSTPMINGPISSSTNMYHHSGQADMQARSRSNIAATANPSAAGSSGVGGVHGKRKADTAAETGMLGRSRLLNSSALADASNSQHRAGAISQRAPLMLPNPHRTLPTGGSSEKQTIHPAYLVQPAVCQNHVK
jgi:hypothetical protein